MGIPADAGDPIEPEAHQGCECSICCPTCAVVDCDSQDVTDTLTLLDPGYPHFAPPKVRARVMLCPEHQPDPVMTRVLAEVERMSAELARRFGYIFQLQPMADLERPAFGEDDRGGRDGLAELAAQRWLRDQGLVSPTERGGGLRDPGAETPANRMDGHGE